MSRSMYGALRVFTFVHFANGDGGFRSKKVTLATIHCDLSEAEQKMVEFREVNKHIPAVDLHARFEYSEHIG